MTEINYIAICGDPVGRLSFHGNSATDAFSRRPLSRASRPFTGPMLKARLVLLPCYCGAITVCGVYYGDWSGPRK